MKLSRAVTLGTNDIYLSQSKIATLEMHNNSISNVWSVVLERFEIDKNSNSLITFKVKQSQTRKNNRATNKESDK